MTKEVEQEIDRSEELWSGGTKLTLREERDLPRGLADAMPDAGGSPPELRRRCRHATQQRATGGATRVAELARAVAARRRPVLWAQHFRGERLLGGAGRMRSRSELGVWSPGRGGSERGGALIWEEETRTRGQSPFRNRFDRCVGSWNFSRGTR